DLALEKVEHQLRRLHERRVRRGNRARRREARDTPTNGRGDRDDLGGLGDLADAEENDGTGPAIVKTKQFAVKPMHPEEAALQMELLGHDFFLFRNTESDNAAVLYRRRDG